MTTRGNDPEAKCQRSDYLGLSTPFSCGVSRAPQNAKPLHSFPVRKSPRFTPSRCKIPVFLLAMTRQTSYFFSKSSLTTRIHHFRERVTMAKEEGPSRVTCGIVAILLGGLGIHKFMLGNTTGGIIMIVLTLCTCGIGSTIGLIEGIIYLTKTDEEFYQTYVVEKKGWF
jgi:TM2 domain-containing membrane protein YozV